MSTATVSRATGYPVPAAGADLNSEPVRTQLTNIVDFLEGGNIATGNVDVTEVATLGTANTWTAKQTLNDNVKLSLGTGGDVEIYYDATDLIIKPAAVGAGDIVVNGGSIEFDDSEGVTLGTGKDATLRYDGTHVVMNTRAVGSGNFNPGADDGGALGTSGTGWSDLFLASGAVVNFNAGDVTLTHGSGYLNFSADKIFINDTANTGLTVGLTINQGASDDEILSFKSSDITHGVTGIAETDTWGMIRKWSGTDGGIGIHGFSDVSTAAVIRGIETTETTTDTSASVANIFMYSSLKSGTGTTTQGATGNIFGVSNNGTTRLLLKGNGDMHITNTTLTALDDEDDIALVRASQAVMSNGMGMAMDEWDEHLKATEDDLRRVGVLRGDFINVQRYNSLIGGSVVQLYKRMMQHAKMIEENVPQLKGKLLPQGA